MSTNDPMQWGTELKLHNSLKAWLRSMFRTDHIDRFSPETKQLFIDTLRRTANTLEKSL